MATIEVIQKKTQQYADARLALADVVRALHDQMELAKRDLLPQIKKAVAKTLDLESDLLAQIKQSPELFEKPKSLSFNGIKIGFQKGKGKLLFDDADLVIKLIKRHFPKQADVLINTTEKPVKDALSQLTVAELKTLSITVEGTGDVAFIKDTTSDVDKLVKALLKGAEEEAEE